MRMNSIKFEISVLYTLILGIILIFFSGVLYFLLAYTLYNELDSDLALKATGISNSIRVQVEKIGNSPDALALAIQNTISLGTGNLPSDRGKNRKLDFRWLKTFNLSNLEEDYIHVAGKDGQEISSSSNFNDDLKKLFNSMAAFPKDLKGEFFNINFKQKKIRVMNDPFELRPGENYLIQIGTSLQPIAQLLQNWLNSLFVCIPIILLLTTLVGQYLAGQILETVQRITETAQKISYQDLNARVTAKHYYVEMQHLVDAFNEMIDRLEKSFSHIEQFSSHVSHELKTPLTIIKGESELALKKDRDVNEYKRVVAALADEAQKMLRIIDDLLLLARLDFQPRSFKFELVPFNDFFTEITEQSKILCAPKHIKIHIRLPDETVLVHC